MRKLKVVLMIIALAFLISAIPVFSARADSGPKPTLTIYVNNFDSKDYYLDLLGNEYTYMYFNATDGNKKYDSMHDTPIYKHNEGGWKAIHMRTSVLKGNLQGEYDSVTDTMVHRFSYMGVPKEFKIIVQKKDGTLQVSNIIKNEYFNSIVYYDMQKNKATIQNSIFMPVGSVQSIPSSSSAWDNLFTRCSFTLAVEMLIALLFKIKKWKVIIWTNISTQILLNAALTYLCGRWGITLMTLYITSEVAITLLEFLIYVKYIRNISKLRLFIYSLTANIMSFLLGLIMFYWL